ncbi:hypothetical protein [Marinifilum sp.]|uniref:hypothetical protein n=1 Tax=Marinifilum sp. TaxID=2033137 RepID=UPI003BADA2A0
MQKQIVSANLEILRQLIHLCENIHVSHYSMKLDLLSKNTIGKHLRHIIEFYDILIEASEEDKPVSYDNRTHCSETETNLALAIQRLNRARTWFKINMESKALELIVSYDNVQKKSVSVPTNLERELIYNIEHAIHHMAIIRIAIQKEFPEIKLDKHFGIAYSTIRYRDDLCAH